MILSVHDLAFGYNNVPLTVPLSLQLSPGEVICILGPNGVGKTTFFKTLQGFLPSISGSIELDGTDIRQLGRKNLAQKIAYVPQIHGQPFSYSALDMVQMGRAPYLQSLSSPGEKDRELCLEIMQDLAIGHLAARSYSSLSGGEQQMVLIARALAQEPALLMMDEPTSSLDYGNQLRVLEHILRLRRHDLGVMMITHAPEQAFMCADKTVLFLRDKEVRVGKTNDVLTKKSLLSAYGIPISLFRNIDETGSTVTTCSPIMQY